VLIKALFIFFAPSPKSACVKCVSMARIVFYRAIYTRKWVFTCIWYAVLCV